MQTKAPPTHKAQSASAKKGYGNGRAPSNKHQMGQKYRKAKLNVRTLFSFLECGQASCALALCRVSKGAS